jgi:hypothetical protein
MAPAAVNQIYPEHSRKLEDDKLTLVHYFNRSKTAQGRFEFARGKGLTRVEARLQPPNGASTSQLRNKLMTEYAGRYGEPTDGEWSDDQMTLRIGQRGGEYVAIVLTPTQ